MHLVSGVARGPGSPRQVERVLYVAADVWAVLVRSERYRGVALKRREQGLGFAGQKLVADGVQAVAPLLRLVVRCEHRGDPADDLGARRRNHERRDGAVIEPEQARDRQSRAAPRPPSGRDEDALLHADVAQDPRSELRVGLGLDTPAGQSLLQEPVEAAVVLDEEGRKRSVHGWPPTQSSPMPAIGRTLGAGASRMAMGA